MASKSISPNPCLFFSAPDFYIYLLYISAWMPAESLDARGIFYCSANIRNVGIR